MSDGPDKESQTEDPTEKRLQDAAERGNDPVSREAPLFASLLALLAVTGLLVKPAALDIVNAMQNMLDSLGERRLSGAGDAQILLAEIGLKFGAALAPLLLVVMAFGLASHFAQSLPRFITSRIAPDFSRISIGAGLGRLFSMKGVVQFGKQALQLSIVGFALTLVLRSEQGRIMDLLYSRAVAIPTELLSLMFRLTATVATASAVIVVGDIVWTRMQWMRDQRMSKQEIKDEARQSEGDPMVKARLRSLALDRARKRMMAQVPRATMVIAKMNARTSSLVLDKAMQLLGGGQEGVTLVQTDLARVQQRVGEASDRLTIQSQTLAKSIGSMEDGDAYAVSVRLNSLSTQIETSYALTSRIQNLSLLKYL